MKHKLSPWFWPNKTPVRDGVYKTRLFYHNVLYLEGWSRWDGYWSDTCLTKKAAAVETKCGQQNKHWQGIVR